VPGGCQTSAGGRADAAGSVESTDVVYDGFRGQRDVRS
jgi:hypothetical protein